MKTFSSFKKTTVMVICAGSLCMGTMFSGGCSSVKSAWNGMTQTGQGAVAGGTAGAAVGAGVGALIGGGKGTWIGALVGSAIGAGAGSLVGNSMDRQRKQLEAELASVKELASKKDTTYIVQTVKDSNNLDAIKLVLGNSVLFKTNSSQLSAEAESTLNKIAYNLKQFPDTDVTVVGYTDNTGTEEINRKLSLDRAQSVVNDLEALGISADRLKAVGEGWNDPIASNATPDGRAQNRRVELFITASKQMVEKASQESHG